MSIELKRIETPDLFLAIVAPIGVDINHTISAFEKNFTRFGYKTKHIKVTEYFKNLNISGHKISDSDLETRYRTYIDFGNALREKSQDDSILAALAIEEICQHREKRNNNVQKPYAYIIRQFKRTEELDLCRRVYGKFFFQISVFSSKQKRREVLASKFADSSHKNEESAFYNKADELIQIDEDEIETSHGQRVSKAFHQADFIINADLEASYDDQVNRFLDLTFGNNRISPTPDEYGMYTAKASALRSLDLSRQVGAAIFSNDQEIISMGCNEVPKGGGGTYWPIPGVTDARDHTKNEDPNEKRKKNNVYDFLWRLKDLNYINTDEIDIDKIFNDPVIKDSSVMDTLEFGRIVHAEMSAISDASRLGRPTKGATLYCTTFPCHMCAKHIVASGIKDVVYLEPYPKSAAYELHKDAISVDGEESHQYKENTKTIFRHFFGVTPRRYRDFFEKEKRKKDGKFLEWKFGKPSPVYDLIIDLPRVMEMVIVSGPLKDIKEEHKDIFIKT